ncbi:MAG TPA: SigB/SigF/SigG family RNA polymerase sigma factor [Acidimicrobiales bacterium]|nr:SigB/SigF/SigG family RNA polymerase sigma factor [Acidimicrobiales bacterium]
MRIDRVSRAAPSRDWGPARSAEGAALAASVESSMRRSALLRDVVESSMRRSAATQEEARRLRAAAADTRLRSRRDRRRGGALARQAIAAAGERREGTRAWFAELARTRDPELRDLLVAAHLGLAHHLAKRFTNRGEPYDDLVQVASLGLVYSVDRFDPGRGVEFSTFATRTILGELKRHFRDKGWLVRAPRRLQELHLELREVTDSLSQQLGRSPTVAELAEATGSTDEAVLEALEAWQGYRARSIDAPGDHDTLADRIGGEDRTFVAVDNRSVLGPAIGRLAPRDQVILRLRFGDGLSQSEIARRVGVSQMQVSRLLAASLTRLRNEFAAGG